MQYARTNRFIFPIGISYSIIKPHIPALDNKRKYAILLQKGRMRYARTKRFIFPIGISLCIIEPHIPA